MTRVRLSSHWSKSGHEVVTTVGASVPNLIVVDLSDPQALDHVPNDKASFPTTTIVAFGPHIHTEILADARKAGADHVMARGKLMEKVGVILKKMEEPSV